MTIERKVVARWRELCRQREEWRERRGVFTREDEMELQALSEFLAEDRVAQLDCKCAMAGRNTQ